MASNLVDMADRSGSLVQPRPSRMETAVSLDLALAVRDMR